MQRPGGAPMLGLSHAHPLPRRSLYWKRLGSERAR